MPRYIDLTLDYDERIQHFSKDVARMIEKDGWNAHNLHIYSHAGTHMDAPMHFGVNSTTIEQYSIQRLISNCHVIQMPDCPPRRKISINDLGDKAERIKEGESVLFATGWSRHLGKRSYRDELPRISKELADWLVLRKVNMILVEPPSVADVNNKEEVTDIHERLLGGNIIIVEGICHTENLRSDFIRIMAFPLKIKNGDGAPARVIAMEDD